MYRWVLGIALSFVLLVPLTSADNASTAALEGGYHDPLYVNSMVPYLNSSATGGAENILTWSGTTFELDNAEAAFEVQQNGTLDVLTSSGDIELQPAGNVGIGVENPSKALSVNGSISSAGNLTKDGEEVATQVFVRAEAILRDNITGPRGALQFANGSKLDEAADLVYNATSNRLGVATISPDETLDVNGTVAVRSGTNISVFSTDESLSGDSDSALPTEQAVKQYVDASPGGAQGAVQFNDAPGLGGDVDVLFVNQSTGQIGVATRNPTDTFEVNGTARFLDNIAVDNNKYLNFLDSSGSPSSYLYRSEGNDLFLVNNEDGQNIKNVVQADGGFYVQNNTYSTLFKVGGKGSASLRGDLNFLESYQNIYGDNLKIWGASDTSLNLQPPGSSTGNVGINTVNPSAELDVNGSAAVKRGTDVSEFSQDTALADASSDALPTEQAVKNYVDTTADGIGLADVLSTSDRADDGQQIEGDRLRARDGDGLKLYDDEGNGIFIQDGGNVGIGTDSPGQALDIVGGTGNVIPVRIKAESGADGKPGIEFEDPTAENYGGRAYFDDTSNTMKITGLQSGTEKLGIAVDRNNGNVGIGTTSPAQRLDVAGSVVLGNGTAVNEFSTDDTLSDNSNKAIPTEQAVKQYQEDNDFDSWTVAGDSGSTTVNSGDILTVAGGSGLTSSESNRNVSMGVNTGEGIETNNDEVRLASEAAGSGLSGGAGSPLGVNAGNALTVNSDDVEVATDGIGNSEIDNTVNVDLGTLDVSGGAAGDGSDSGFTVDSSGNIYLSGSLNFPGNVNIVDQQTLNGSFLPSQDASFDLGSSSQTWRDLELARNFVLDGTAFTESNLDALSDGTIQDSEVINDLTIGTLGSVQAEAIAREGATSGQVLAWDGSNWQPAPDNSGTDDQNLQATSRSDGTVTIPIESGSSTSFTDNYAADDQDLGVSNDPTGGSTTITIDDGNSATFTDDYEANTDNQNLQSTSRSGSTVTIPIESGSGTSFTDEQGMTSWVIAGDTGSTTVTNGSTVTLSGGTQITTSESSGTVTINNGFGSSIGTGEATFTDQGVSTTDRVTFNDVTLNSGTSVSEFSTDEGLSGDSDNAVPTERAVKSYVDNNSATAGGSDGDFQYNNGGAIGGTTGMHWDDSNNRIGIGTSSPDAKVEVDGDVRLSGDIISDSGDVAEWLNASNVSKGDVGIIGDDGDFTTTDVPASYNARGVVTTDPAMVLGENTSGKARVALTGTAPVNVVDENGDIQAGDLLVTSSTPGHVMRAEDKGMAVGTALEGFDGEDGQVKALLNVIPVPRYVDNRTSGRNKVVE